MGLRSWIINPIIAGIFMGAGHFLAFWMTKLLLKSEFLNKYLSKFQKM